MGRAAEAPRWLMPAVAAAHGAALLALLQTPGVPVTPPRPLAVALLAPAAPEPAPARPEPSLPQPRPVVRPRAASAATPPAPTAFAASEPTPAAAPSEPMAAAPAPSATQPATATQPAAVAQPARFDAAYLRNPKPPYPSLARRLGEQGRVLLRVFVSAHGLPEKVEIESSSGSPRLDASALETVRVHWRFEPARLGDKPVPDWVRVPIGFILEG